MKVLITGVSGFVGGALAKELVAQGYDVYGFSRSKLALPGVKAINWSGLESFDSNDEAMQEVFTGIDFVVHCAARVHVMNETALDPQAEFDKQNTDATVELAKCAAKQGVKKFIFLSTIGVLGDSTSDSSFNRHSRVQPHSPYALSKLNAEKALTKISAESQMDCISIRPPLIYGVDAPGNFKKLIAIVEKGVPLPFKSTGNERAFVAVENLVSFIIACLEYGGKINGALLVNDGENISTSELLRRISESRQENNRLFYFPPMILSWMLKLIGKSGMATQLLGSLRIDCKEEMVLLNWQPEVTMKSVLKEIFVNKNKRNKE